MIVGQSFEEVQAELLAELHYEPQYECRPRGQLIKELLCGSFRLTDPRARLTASPSRAANYGFAAGEFLWYLAGRNDLESIAYYNKRMPQFSDDGMTVNSAYGARIGIARTEGESAQWDNVADELVRDNDSRRAVMTIFRPQDLVSATKDVPCTVAIQFFIRPHETTGTPSLQMHVTMRSNDVIWGLCNDLFSFTLMQEVMLLDLRERGLVGLRLGSYYHTAGSMHLYERHFKLAETMLAEGYEEPLPMPSLTSRASLRQLLACEVFLRNGLCREADFDALRSTLPNLSGERWLLERLIEHRQKRDKEESDGE